MTEFDLPATAENYDRWASTDPSVPALSVVLADHGDWQAALDGAAEAGAGEPPLAPSHQTRREAWDEQWGAAVADRAAAGRTQTEIAADLDQPIERVRSYLWANGIKTVGMQAGRRQEAWDIEFGPAVRDLANGERTQVEIAAELDQPIAKVRALLLANGIKTAGQSRRTSPNADRNRQIVEMWATGATLAEVGERFGLTRERVRQLVNKAEAERETTPMDLRRAAHAARWIDFTDTYGPKIRFLAAQCTSIDQIHGHLPDTSAADIAEFLREHGIRCRGDRPVKRRWSDDDVLTCLQVAFDELGPLTVKSYADWAREHEVPGPQTVFNRFGSWTNGMQRAGLEVTLGTARTYRYEWTTQRCIEAVRAWLATAECPSSGEFEMARRSGAELPSLGTLRRFVGGWNQTIRCAEMWQQILDSGAMTVADADLEPKFVATAGVARPPVDVERARADVTRFIGECLANGVHPSTLRYDAWALEHPDVSRMRHVVEAFDSWNAALVACGHTDIRQSPNPLAT
jgi:hypothetical protein